MNWFEWARRYSKVSGVLLFRIDFADDLAGNRELAAEPGAERYESRLAEVERALRSPGLLTSYEKRVMRLRFSEGLKVATIAEKLRVSEGPIKKVLRSGVRKLRSHFAEAGLETLPLEAPIDA